MWAVGCGLGVPSAVDWTVRKRSLGTCSFGMTSCDTMLPTLPDSDSMTDRRGGEGWGGKGRGVGGKIVVVTTTKMAFPSWRFEGGKGGWWLGVGTE